MTGKILSGSESSFEKIRKGVGEVLFERADLYADNTFQIDALTGIKETFANVKLRSTRLAISLQKLGITSEDVVVTCLKITMDTVIPHLATLYLGAKFAAIDQIQTETDWRHCLGIVKPKVIFIDEDQSQRIKKCLGDIGMKSELIVYGESKDHRTFENLVQPCPEEDSFRPKVIQNCGDTAVICFSSGTTGLPKAMTIPHFSLVNGRQLFLEIYGTEFFNVELIFSSYYWINHPILLVRRHFTGGCLVLFSKFDPENALRAIDTYKVSSCFISPVISQQLLKVENIQDYDLSSVKLYLSAGTSISPEHLSRLRGMFRKGFVLNTYGSTEAGGDMTKNDFYTESNTADNPLQTVGKCSMDTKIKIIDEESHEILGPNEPGEIWAKCLYGMSGYYNNSTPSNLDQDGFYQTGDLGYYDESKYIYINGRSNEIFKYGMLKVAPVYWESVLQNHPKVDEAGVFGIPHDSVGWLPAACIVLKKNVTATVEEIEEFFMKEMTEKHRLAGGIRFVKELPKTPSSKLRRHSLLGVFTTGTYS